MLMPIQHNIARALELNNKQHPSTARGPAGVCSPPPPTSAKRRGARGTSCTCGVGAPRLTSPASQRMTRPRATDPDAGRDLSNVIAYDKSARDSIQNFESGNGDVAITYENEVKTANRPVAATRPCTRSRRPDREPGRGRRQERRRRTASRTSRTRSWSSSTRRTPRRSTPTLGFLRSTDPAKAAGRRPGQRLSRRSGPVHRRRPRRLGRADTEAVRRRRDRHDRRSRSG